MLRLPSDAARHLRLRSITEETSEFLPQLSSRTCTPYTPSVCDGVTRLETLNAILKTQRTVTVQSASSSSLGSWQLRLRDRIAGRFRRKNVSSFRLKNSRFPCLEKRSVNLVFGVIYVLNAADLGIQWNDIRRLSHFCSDTGFGACFLFEFLVRCYAYGYSFALGVFDGLPAASAVFAAALALATGLVMDSAEDPSPAVAVAVRVLRLLRLVKLVRLPERLHLDSNLLWARVSKAGRIIGGVAVLLAVALVSGALFGTALLSGYELCTDTSGSCTFSSLLSTMRLHMVFILPGDWPNAVEPLLSESWLWSVYITFFVCISRLFILSALVAVICGEGMAVSDGSLRQPRATSMQRAATTSSTPSGAQRPDSVYAGDGTAKLAEVFSRAKRASDGTVDVETCFRLLDLIGVEKQPGGKRYVRRITEVLDPEDTGRVTCEDWVDAIRRLAAAGRDRNSALLQLDIWERYGQANQAVGDMIFGIGDALKSDVKNAGWNMIREVDGLSKELSEQLLAWARAYEEDAKRLEEEQEEQLERERKRLEVEQEEQLEKERQLKVMKKNLGDQSLSEDIVVADELALKPPEVSPRPFRPGRFEEHACRVGLDAPLTRMNVTSEVNAACSDLAGQLCSLRTTVTRIDAKSKGGQDILATCVSILPRDGKQHADVAVWTGDSPLSVILPNFRAHEPAGGSARLAKESKASFASDAVTYVDVGTTISNDSSAVLVKTDCNILMQANARAPAANNEPPCMGAVVSAANGGKGQEQAIVSAIAMDNDSQLVAATASAVDGASDKEPFETITCAIATESEALHAEAAITGTDESLISEAMGDDAALLTMATAMGMANDGGIAAGGGSANGAGSIEQASIDAAAADRAGFTSSADANRADNTEQAIVNAAATGGPVSTSTAAANRSEGSDDIEEAAVDAIAADRAASILLADTNRGIGTEEATINAAASGGPASISTAAANRSNSSDGIEEVAVDAAAAEGAASSLLDDANRGNGTEEATVNTAVSGGPALIATAAAGNSSEEVAVNAAARGGATSILMANAKQGNGTEEAAVNAAATGGAALIPTAAADRSDGIEEATGNPSAAGSGASILMAADNRNDVTGGASMNTAVAASAALDMPAATGDLVGSVEAAVTAASAASAALESPAASRVSGCSGEATVIAAATASTALESSAATGGVSGDVESNVIAAACAALDLPAATGGNGSNIELSAIKGAAAVENAPLLLPDTADADSGGGNKEVGKVGQEATMHAADVCQPVPTDVTGGIKVGEEASSTAAVDSTEDVLPPARASCESNEHTSVVISAALGVGSGGAGSQQSDGNKAQHRGWAADSQAAQRRQQLLESLRKRRALVDGTNKTS